MRLKRGTYRAFKGLVASLFITSNTFASDFIYTPDRNSVPLAPSIELKGSVNDYIELLYNRGRDSVVLKDEVMKMLTPSYIRSLKGFRSYKTTRLDLSVYEFRLIEILPQIEALLKKGIQLRFVADPSTFKVFKPFTPSEFASLSEDQQKSYMKSYDLDKDGEVSKSDIDQVNEKRYLAVEAHKQLKALKKKFPKQVELIAPPYERVSHSDLLPFPRLHHLKDVSIDFLKGDEWKSQVSLRSSANLTDSCMDQRISQSQKNKDRYVDRNFAETNMAKGSQGNVQFGALLKGSEILDSIQSIKEKWLAQYKRGKHFDEGKLDETVLPRIVIEDDKTGHRSTLETFYSEGTKADGRKKVDPVLVAIHHLSGPDKTLKLAYSSQFVSTHVAKNHAWRYLMAKSGQHMEDFFVVVDSKFATQAYSALPHLTFAPRISMQYGTLEGKAVVDLPAIPEHLSWQDSVYSYEGDQGVFGADGDKMHAKVDYYEYETLEGKRHYLLVWGSANSSKNSAKGNADSIHVLDTTDPSIARQVKKYFNAIKGDSRLFPYSLSYIDMRFREAFRWDQRILHEEFLKSFENILNQNQKSKTQLNKALKALNSAGAHTKYGKNMLRLLNWFAKHSKVPLSWEEFYIISELSQPNRDIPAALSDEVLKRWKVKHHSTKRSFKLNISRLDKGAPRKAVAKNVSRILENCAIYLKRLGIDKSPSAYFAEVSP